MIVMYSAMTGSYARHARSVFADIARSDEDVPGSVLYCRFMSSSWIAFWSAVARSVPIVRPKAMIAKRRTTKVVVQWEGTGIRRSTYGVDAQ